MRMLSVIITLLLAVPASAQTRAEKVEDWVSTGLVGVNMTAEAIHDFKHGCGISYLVKNGVSFIAAEGLKNLVHEDRPNHTDQKSWPSEHSWIGAMNTGWSIKFGFTIALGAGAGRVLSNYHNPWDVASGLLIGALVQHYFPCSE